MKTLPTDVSPRDFVAAVAHPQRRADAAQLLDLFARVTGYVPTMWGPSIVGYGRYNYRYDSGHEGTSMATGFSPRKASLSIYIMPGYQDYGAILSDLGKHKLGKACLYINKLSDVDLTVLERLIQRGLKDLNAIWPVEPI